MRSSSISDQPYKGLVCKFILNFEFPYFPGWVGGWGELKLQLISADAEARASSLGLAELGNREKEINFEFGSI